MVKKGIIISILSVISVLLLVFGLTACDIFGETAHEHEFNKHNTDIKYLKSEATCTSRALYYYSCACGEKGEEVFVDGKALGHIGGVATCSEPATCSRCGEKYGKTAAVGNHNYVDGACSWCDASRTSGLTYNLSADGTYYSVNKGVCTWEKIHIRASYNGKPVKEIEKEGFANSSNLQSIVIPDSIISIGSKAFSNCRKLSEINLPEITVIEDGVFSDCWELAEITIPKTVTSIGKNAFRNCSGFSEIILPDSITSIGSEAFYQCMKLKSIVIPRSITALDVRVFGGCKSLTSVFIPDSVKSIGSDAFQGCTALVTIDIPDSVSFISTGAFYYCTALETIILPDLIDSIENSTFSECKALRDIVIPSTVRRIKDNNFLKSENLSNVYFGGTKNEWETILIDYNNSKLFDAVRYYYSEKNPYENNPDDAELYWHYVDGFVTVWEKE